MSELAIIEIAPDMAPSIYVENGLEKFLEQIRESVKEVPPSLAGKSQQQPSTTDVAMHIQQFNNLKKIAAQFGNDYQLSSELYDRHVELIDAVSGADMDEAFERSLLRSGVRKEILDAARESCEFEEIMSTFKRELTGIIARLDLADQIDSKRNAA